MKSSAKRLHGCFSLVIGAAAVWSLQAQTSSPATKPLTTDCIRWLTTTPCFKTLLTLAAFAREQAQSQAWAGQELRGPACILRSETREGTSAIVCQGTGKSTKDLGLAAGFEAASDDQAYTVPGAGGAVTLFTRTAVWIGGLRVPAGFYSLRPLSSSKRWKLLVLSHDSTPEDGQQSLGSVNLETALGGFAENTLRVEFSLFRPTSGRRRKNCISSGRQ